MSLKDYFWPEDPKNTVKRTYCKSCVSHQLDSVGATTAGVVEGSQAFKDFGGGFTVGTGGGYRGRSRTMYGAVEIEFTGISAALRADTGMRWGLLMRRRWEEETAFVGTVGAACERDCTAACTLRTEKARSSMWGGHSRRLGLKTQAAEGGGERGRGGMMWKARERCG
ncbi:hypothetical protein FB451DRAFT_1186874 [Mycena latifolia]|nr:hypothetical protein FB451DRAFT_1186874 [Mycena latifolia]